MTDKPKPITDEALRQITVNHLGEVKFSGANNCADIATTVNAMIARIRTDAAEIEELIMVTDWGIDHLQRRADLDHAGIAQGGGREWSRALWGAFAEYEKIASKRRHDSDVKAKELRKKARSDEAFIASENQIADKNAEIKRLRDYLGAAGDGFRSFQYGNSSTDFARRMADKIDAALKGGE